MNTAGEPIRIPILFTESDPDMTAIVARAMTEARAAQPVWARTTVKQRLQLVRELRHLIAERAKALAEASASARQRPVVESLTAEVMPLVEACRFLERKAAQILATRRVGRKGRPLWLAGIRTEIERAPFGVVVIIGPGNYPLLLPGVQVIQALVAGNAVLLKPGGGGMRAAQELCALIVRAGIDSRLVTVLPESTEAARIAIAAQPDKLIFTGSSATGEKILAQLAPHLIPATMELSGNDAVIIRADADLELVAKALTFGLKLNAGATCMAPKRAFVHWSLATELEGRLAQHFGRGRGSLDQTHPPALVTGSAKGDVQKPDVKPGSTRLCTLVSDALSRGAHFVAGGVLPDGTISLPAVLAGVSPNSDVLQEDLFAPLLSMVTVTDDREAVALTNESRHALTVSIFSRDEAAARYVAGQIHAGVVTINDLIVPTADARVPFGGCKRSGFGATRGAEGLLELTTAKVVTRSRGKLRPAFEPPQPGDEQMFEAYLQLANGRGLKARWAVLATLLRIVARRWKSISP